MESAPLPQHADQHMSAVAVPNPDAVRAEGLIRGEEALWSGL